MAALMDNVKLGGKPEQVLLFECCVSDHSSNVSLDKSGGSWGYKMVHENVDSAGSIVAKTLDEILRDANCGDRQIDLFKCDIEGAEALVFARPGAWLLRTRCLAVETHAPYCDVNLIDDLMQACHRYTIIRENELVFARRN